MTIPALAPRHEEGPKVSVIMPTWRRGHAIERTIDTLLNGTFSDFELLVRDDGPSGDVTEAVVRAICARDPRVHYQRNTSNMGLPGNLNGGIAASTGEYVVVCHDHDLYLPGYLEKLTSLLDEHEGAAYAHCGLEQLDHVGRPTGQLHIGPWAARTAGREWLEFMLQRFACPVSALTMVRRSAHEAFGLYDPDYGMLCDVEMWMRLAEHGDVAYAPGPLVQVMGREPSHTLTDNPWPAIRAIFAIHRKYLERTRHGLARAVRLSWLAARADTAVLRTMGSRLRRGQRPVTWGDTDLAAVGGRVTKLIDSVRL